MKKIKRFLASRLSPGEAGQALILVLIFLVLGSLTLVPTLTHISTALKTGEIYEESTNELYTADAGIEDGLWRIKYDFMGVDYNPYDFETTFPYQTEDLNGMMADFTIKNVWFPTDVNLADPDDPCYMSPDDVREMMESEKLIVSGSALPGQPYRILIDFNPDAGDYLTIKSLGVWLPRDFTYVTDSCSLQVDGEIYEPDDIAITEVPGGYAIVWGYDAPYPYISDFPGFDDNDMSFNFTFEYTPPAAHPGWRPAAVAWVTTEMLDEFGNPKFPLNTPENVPVSWDIDTLYFQIISEAGDTAIEAYTSKNELRQMGDAMSGDYVAIGNSLLADDDGDDKRDDWHTPSSFDINDPTDNVSIPDNADVAYAYLYWAGWRNENAIDVKFSDTCSNFNNWVITGTAQSQPRVPNEDSSSDGDWTRTPSGSPNNYWSRIDETTPDDANYITGTTNSGGYRVFDFSDFSVPDGSEIIGLTIYYRAKLVSGSSPDNNLRAYIRVDGDYTSGPSVDPGTDWTTYSYNFTENPETGDPWTADDINGDSGNSLERFGIRADHFNPDIQVSMVYAVVEYYESAWSLSSGRFHGTGSSDADPDPRTLTLKDGINLTSYGSGIFNISWDQDESGNLSDDDIFYFAFSGDGGSTWSPYYEAFRGNDPESPFTYNIPDDYVTDNFKVRFYFNFNSSSESVYLDNIKITYLPIDTEVIFKIDDVQVYLDGSTPAIGLNPVTAGRSYAMLNTMWGAPYGFSYMCVRDVSALVKTYPIDPDEEHHTGNTKYTVDGVSADIRNPNNSLSDFAFAGWSLIIVYACPETAGHYIYIRDNNFAFHPGTGGNLDFDDDPTYPGGIITGFKIPNPITDKYGQIIETVAAKLTCFIVEGDDFSNDSSSITVTGQQSGQSMSLTNPSCEINDVWNGRSYPGTFNEGVDIDTFEIDWDDGILTPGDNQLQVDMLSLNDAWNLVYFIISVRSETVTTGTTHYVIYGN